MTCAILQGGAVRCWGDNSFSGDLGLGSTTAQTVTMPVSLGVAATAISVGDHVCALLSNNTLRCWGYNGFGELGLGNATEVSFTMVPSASYATTVAFPGRPHATVHLGWRRARLRPHGQQPAAVLGLECRRPARPRVDHLDRRQRITDGRSGADWDLRRLERRHGYRAHLHAPHRRRQPAVLGAEQHRPAGSAKPHESRAAPRPPSPRCCQPSPSPGRPSPASIRETRVVLLSTGNPLWGLNGPGPLGLGYASGAKPGTPDYVAGARPARPTCSLHRDDFIRVNDER